MAEPAVPRNGLSEAQAHDAGLHRACAEHRADVEEAAAAATAMRAGFTRPTDPAEEPLPAWRAPVARRRTGRIG